jgi:hypothetical protein
MICRLETGPRFNRTSVGCQCVPPSNITMITASSHSGSPAAVQRHLWRRAQPHLLALNGTARYRGRTSRTYCPTAGEERPASVWSFGTCVPVQTFSKRTPCAYTPVSTSVGGYILMLLLYYIAMLMSAARNASRSSASLPQNLISHMRFALCISTCWEPIQHVPHRLKIVGGSPD